MKLIFFVVALLISTTAALEKDQFSEKLKIASGDLKLTDHFKAKRISLANFDRVRRGVDPQCQNAAIQAVRKCPFNITEIIDAYNIIGGEDAALTVKRVKNILCSNDGCYNTFLNYFKICGFQFLAQRLEKEIEFDCKVNANGTYCFEAFLAFSDNTSSMCLQSVFSATCRSDHVCNEHFKNLIVRYGCCMKEIMDRRLAILTNFDFFDFCDLSNPGNCLSTNRSKVTPPASPSTNILSKVTPSASPFASTTPSSTSPPTTFPTESPSAPSPTPPPSPTTPSDPMRPLCNQKTIEFINMRECSAGVDFRSAMFSAPTPSSCEQQLFFSRFCQSQKCLNNLVDLVEVCLNGTEMDEQRIPETKDHLILLNSKLYCARDSERKDFCAVMFPEFINPFIGPHPVNLTCAIYEVTGSCSTNQECVDAVKSAADHYGCCLSKFLKIVLKVDPQKLYERCGVNPPDPCRTKLKNNTFSRKYHHHKLVEE